MGVDVYVCVYGCLCICGCMCVCICVCVLYCVGMVGASVFVVTNVLMKLCVYKNMNNVTSPVRISNR